MATPTPDDRELVKRSGREYTWGDFAKKVVSIIAARHTSAYQTICVNDVYDLENTIKDDERDRRSSKVKVAPNLPVKAADKLQSSLHFKSALANSSNKVRLQILIEHCLREYCSVSGKEIIYCKNVATNLLTNVPVEEFNLKHAEADKVIFTTYYHVRENGWQGPVLIDAEDTDIYIQASYVSHEIEGKLLIRRKQIFVDCRSMLSDEIAAIIIQLYDISGNDHNCGFYGRGKKAILEKVMKSPEARYLLLASGDTIPITKNVLKKLKKFVLKFVYGTKKSTCAEAEAYKLFLSRLDLKISPTFLK